MNLFLCVFSRVGMGRLPRMRKVGATPTLVATLSVVVFLCGCVRSGGVVEAMEAASGGEPTAMQDRAVSDVDRPPSPLRLEPVPASLTLIQSGGCYGRMIRLLDGDLLCAFEYGGAVSVRRSGDDGATWTDRIEAVSWPHGGLANPDLVQLQDGAVLCFYNERPANPRSVDSSTDATSASGGDVYPFAIGCVRSGDGGRTWGKPATIFSGGAEFQNGCWEPAGLELPSGEVQVYFANEAPYRQSDEQEVTLLRSFDAGRSWGLPERVSFRAGSRDGMASPCRLRDGSGIAVAIENNGFNGNLQPEVVFTPLDDNWRSGAIDGASPRRWSALEPMLPAGVYAGAPCLRQLPSGATVLSYQQDDGGDLAKSHMVVRVGDEGARSFTNAIAPFAGVTEAPQLWNSLCVKNERTVAAIATTTVEGTWGVWSIDLVRKP